jgi:hypothetical protein
MCKDAEEIIILWSSGEKEKAIEKIKLFIYEYGACEHNDEISALSYLIFKNSLFDLLHTTRQMLCVEHCYNLEYYALFVAWSEYDLPTVEKIQPHIRDDDKMSRIRMKRTLTILGLQKGGHYGRHSLLPSLETVVTRLGLGADYAYWQLYIRGIIKYEPIETCDKIIKLGLNHYQYNTYCEVALEEKNIPVLSIILKYGVDNGDGMFFERVQYAAATNQLDHLQKMIDICAEKADKFDMGVVARVLIEYIKLLPCPPEVIDLFIRNFGFLVNPRSYKFHECDRKSRDYFMHLIRRGILKELPNIFPDDYLQKLIFPKIPGSGFETVDDFEFLIDNGLGTFDKKLLSNFTEENLFILGARLLVKKNKVVENIFEGEKLNQLISQFDFCKNILNQCLKISDLSQIVLNYF